jgi:hypothetical protein
MQCLYLLSCLRKDDIDEGTDGLAMLASILCLRQDAMDDSTDGNAMLASTFFSYSLEIPRDQASLCRALKGVMEQEIACGRSCIRFNDNG